ncbi:LysR family transcriptional regulator [Novosphingobium sp. Leaf2]|uniref:LysR family transcriptional regulator n=1 Tax=Novosphingobium sp. Leaf2 TaxID=1735670 RepID=UPI0006F9E512|nr:LysR family transcriptional regulator [Novosphingobium sp. Leaf2]KQM13317.1 LysR family transcriptional regulator [Novosphingobium sp. Leaf2]
MDADLPLFVKVAELGSFSAAGQALGISAAMMSKRIMRLEARLGARLLHRTTRKVALTDTGAQLFHELTAIMEALTAAEQRVTNRTRLPSGPLRVAAPTSFGRLHVAPLIGPFLAAYPRVQLHLRLSDAYVDLLDGRFDVAVRVTSAIPPNLQARRLAANRRILCASPAYLAAYGAPRHLQDLAEHRLLAADGQLPWQLVFGTRRKTVEGTSFVRTNSSEIVRELATSGLGIALRSLWDVQDLLNDGRLHPVLPGWEGPADLAIYAVHPKGPGQPAAVQAFTDFLRDAFAHAHWNENGSARQ